MKTPRPDLCDVRACHDYLTSLQEMAAWEALRRRCKAEAAGRRLKAAGRRR
ncbi:hypothetical protein [Brevifollis gellanilyticus]|uniref:Uncharacterized protein n=1 Tax=Brevifollis gellanilyticus TaxID=748831 RepID=A0A512MI55_9BACT|nr:hypothetical protein [Brevifollis gellanilyticus]GEP46409.1 hypothetical protein BGE01nite_57000 [Brevifollis gellanilyticus]